MQNLDLYEKYGKLIEFIEYKEMKNIKASTHKQIKYFKDIVIKYESDISNYLNKISDENVVDYINDADFFKVEKSNYSSRLIIEVRTIIQNFKYLQEDLNEPFKLFVMGIGNYGKSTVINSLLGTKEEHAEVSGIPKTWKVDVFKDSIFSDEATLKYRDGRVVKVTKKEAYELIDKEENKTKDAKKEISNKVREIAKAKKMKPLEIKELRLKIEREVAYYPTIVEVIWGINNSNLLNRFQIVDTPGLDQKNFSGEIKNTIQDYYDKSDGILWILDATTISASKPTELLEKLDKSTQQLGGKKATENMIAVLNQFDKINETSGERNKIMKNVNEVYGDRFKKIIPYSALNAYLGVKTENEQLITESGRKELLFEIHDRFYFHADKIKSERKSESCTNYNFRTIDLIQSYNKLLLSHINRLKQGINNAEVLLNQLKTENEVKLFKYLEKYKKTVQSNLEVNLKIISQIEDVELKQKKIREDIFNYSEFKKEVYLMNKRFEKDCLKYSQQIYTDYNFTQYNNLEKYKKVEDFDETRISEFNYTQNFNLPSLAFSTLSAAGIGMIFGPLGSIVGAGIGALFSISKINKIKEAFMEEANVIVSNLEHEQSILIDKRIKLEVENLKQTLSESFCNVYNLPNDNIENVFIATEEIISSGEKTIEKLNKSNIRFLPSVEELVLSKDYE